VRPIYVETTEGATFPRFKYVAVTYGENSVLSDSIPDAINTLFGAGSSTGPTTGPSTGPTTGPTPVTGTVASLLARAQEEFTAADAALAKQDFATYGKDIKAARADVAAAVKEITAANSGTKTTPTTTPPSTPTTTPSTGGAGSTTSVPGA
jgi:uncharacterized membrane protein (UPF0182 family)